MKKDYIKEAVKIILEDYTLSVDDKVELINKVYSRIEYIQLNLLGEVIYKGSIKSLLNKYKYNITEDSLKEAIRKGLFYKVGHIVRLEHLIYGVERYLREVTDKIYIFKQIEVNSYKLSNSELLLCSEGINKLSKINTNFSLNLKKRDFNNKGVRDKPYYEIAFPNKVRKSLHRFLVGEPKGKVVDHENGVKLDNRMSNLRTCTQQDNVLNRMTNAPIKYKKTSSFNGVSELRKGVFRLDVNIAKNRFSRNFTSEIRASMYSDIIKLGFSEEFARTNHPKEIYDMNVVRRFYNIYIRKNLKN